jgi:hypothetical protein
MKVTFLMILLVFAGFFPGASCAEEKNERTLLYKTTFGLFFHDRGPTSDRHETGIDPNLELQFRQPDSKLWHWLGKPYPMIGLTPNFKGDTSVFYAGLTYEFSLSNQFLNELIRNLTKNPFVAGGVSLALHNGPLHKDEAECRKDSDCGFGYRVLPRLAVELGFKFPDKHGISVFYDHMSHKWILPGGNEGIDHVGLRYHYIWGKVQSDK